MIALQRLDHLVLTVASIEASCVFYRDILGMRVEIFGEGRYALHFGDQKINLHQKGHEFEPKAGSPVCGSADLCLIATTPLADIIRHFEKYGVTIELGPVRRTGATGPIESLYLRDPDGNLIEIANLIGA